MKKILSLLFISFSIFACDDSSSIFDETYTITFINNSSYDITVSDSFGNDFSSFTVNSGDSYELTNYEYSTLLDSLSFTNENRVEYSESGSTITFTDMETYTITFINNSSYTVTVEDSYGDNFDTFSISAGETKVVDSTSSYDSYTLSGSTENYSLTYTQSNFTVTITQYEYLVEYEITGTANSVDITLNNSSGGTEQYDNVSLPYTYSYSTFSDNFLYISAQNQGSTGSVTVTIYYKDSVFETATSSGAYVIATAYGSK